MTRAGAVICILVLVTAIVAEVVQPKIVLNKYDLSKVQDSILGAPVEQYAKKLSFDAQSQTYSYNAGYTPGQGVSGDNNGPKFSASFTNGKDSAITVTDPVNKVDLSFKPKFAVEDLKTDKNRVIYPMRDRNASTVVTLKASGIKEDIILYSNQGDALTLDYDLKLSDGTEARIENDGSLAVYGAQSALLGTAQTGSEKDAELLKKARQKSPKSQIIFTIPAPFIKEAHRKTSPAKAWFSLKDNVLSVHASGLKQATYPLSIDPSVYIETAAKLMRGNNETNLDFDTTNELIQKGKTTGARIPSWSAVGTTQLQTATWNSGTVVAGGYVYEVGGSTGSTNVASVYWAKLNTSTGLVNSPNPGNGTCTNWCTSTNYDIKDTGVTANRSGAMVVAYSGYLYVMGGESTTGTPVNTVLIAKLGANGEPQLWHPTDPVKSNWTYWYKDTNLASTRSFGGAVAYNNRMYLLGGKSVGSLGGVTTVEVAQINPTGTLTAFVTTGMTALTSARQNHNVLVYNDRIYVLGGMTSVGGAPITTVQYIKVASDGTMAATWTTSTAMPTGRASWGGTFATISGGYIYVEGGCSAVNGSGYCTTIQNDIQISSINADGTVTNWSGITGVTNSRIGYGLVAWRGTLYGVGGCSAQNTATGDCTTTMTNVDYGTINGDGDASTVSTSVASGTAPCSGGSPYNCDVPPAGNGASQGGQMSEGLVVNNGFIYIIGGCRTVSSTKVCYTGTNTSATTGNVSYSAIAADGTLTIPSPCTGTNINLVGTWCVDTNTNRQLNGLTGLASFGFTVFNNTIYIYGGTDGSGTWSQTFYRMALNSDGTLDATNGWQSQVSATTGLNANEGYSFVFSRANPSSAGTNPGNLYVIGGCDAAGSSGIGCSNYVTTVYKCNIAVAGTVNGCATTGQQQIDSENGLGGTPNTAGNQGLGLMAGFVYANYIYLVGGSSSGQAQRGAIMYAQIDSTNNIVAVSGGVWQISTNTLSPVRRRGFAFGYNGYLYALAGYSGSGSLNDLLYSKINVSDGSISTFTTSAVTVNPRWDLRAIVANGYVYTVGGCSLTTAGPPNDCSTMTASVQTFQLYNNYSGSPAAYTSTSNTGVDRVGVSSTVVNGYIYAAGGCSVVTCTTSATTDVYYATFNVDGSVGAWTLAIGTSLLPAARAFGKLVTAGGTLYYIGGQDATPAASTTVYYSTPASGVPGAWATASNALPLARTEMGAAVWNNRVYVTGGSATVGGAGVTTVYTSPDLSAGGNITSAWTATGMTAFNIARAGHTTIAYANNLYVLGGWDGTNYLNDVQFAQISAAGLVGAWKYTTSLPQRIRSADGFAYNGYMYIIGGRSAASTCTNNTYIAPISANTTIVSGNNPTGVGDWSQTNVKYSGARYGAGAAYYDGKAYLVGGACAALITTTDRVYYATLQSQPQVAKYSRLIDTDTDVFPQKWLMNGLDNSTGAEWYMRYKSMTDIDGVVNPNEDCGVTPTSAAMSTWGTETNYGIVNLGTPAAYIARDGSNGNTNCARYFYFFVSIDSSQAFGYPEDVSRGPTIADLTLEFTSDPSKRLMHGRTFTGGEQQPEDTPF